MGELKFLSIKNKLLLVYIVITGIVLASAITIIMRVEIASSKEHIISGLNIVGEIVADRCAASLAFSDVESANSNLSSLKSHDAIVYACIRTTDNHEFAEFNKNVEDVFSCESYQDDRSINIASNYIDIFKPIILEGQSIGVVQIKATLDELTARTIEIAESALIIFICLMLVAAFISRRVMTLITGPISDLKDIAQDITNNKDYGLRVKKTSSDEVGVLVESFNNMLNQIQERDIALLEEKDKAEVSALSTKKYAEETEKINIHLENEIKERSRIEEELQELNETLEEKVQERTSELKELNEKIGDIARSAGMAEVASGVLHNVGNVLNSVNVSASVIREQIRKTKADNLARVVKMLDENKENIAEFIEKDEKGKQIPKFLSLLSRQLEDEKDNVFKELDELASNIDHIKNVISMQQSYAGSYGVREQVSLSDLVEDALKINVQGMERHGIEIKRDYEDIPLMYIDKHKSLQVIINLISNARHALVDSKDDNKKLFIILKRSDLMATLEVKDTGVGIDAEDINHLFEYGFKKRRDGHGYGLHHSALVANELGGKITVSSEGLGKGASFIFSIPIDRQANL